MRQLGERLATRRRGNRSELSAVERARAGKEKSRSLPAMVEGGNPRRSARRHPSSSSTAASAARRKAVQKRAGDRAVQVEEQSHPPGNRLETLPIP